MNKDSLPSSVLKALKRIAAFQNPGFYKKQSMRLSTALTPRVIACAEDFPEHVAIPRGCVDEATSLFRSFGSTLQIDDQRQDGAAIDHRFQGTLTDAQHAAVKALLTHDLGALVAPPGMGKTVAGIYLMAKRARNTLLLVHRQPFLDQWIAQLALFLDVDPKSIGRLGGGKRVVTGAIDVAMLQSVVRKDAVADLAAIPATEERLVLATGRYVGEGFDGVRLDTLFLTMPVSWRGTLVQYAGRLHRAHPGKAEVRIYDYVDNRVPVLARMYERRLAGYRSIGYESDAAPA